MNRRQTFAVLAFSLAAIGAPHVFGADEDAVSHTQFQSMANKDGMVTKKDFMAMMEKKFDRMDTSKRGMLSVADIMRLFKVNSGGG